MAPGAAVLLLSLLQDLEHSPGDQRPNQVVLAHLLRDRSLSARLERGEATWLILFDFPAQSPASLAVLQRLGQTRDALGLVSATRPVLPAGTSVIREAQRGPLHLLWVAGAGPWPGAAVARPPPPEPPPAAAPEPARAPPPQEPLPTLRARLNAALAKDEVRRVVLPPADRPYRATLLSAAGNPRLAPGDLTWFTPSLDEVRACERRFVEDALSDLESGRSTVVPAMQRWVLRPLLEAFPRAERQVTGWAARGTRVLYLRFRPPAPHLPPLEREYQVFDGGHAFFEFQCRLPDLHRFNLVFHGEA